MASVFANNEKVKLVAAAVADSCDYTRASVSKMPQSEFANKKYGRSYKVYIPGVPKVVEGVVADPSDVVEIETEITLQNDNVSVELTAWNRLGDIESFKDQIAKPYGNALARKQEKKIIANNVFKSAQAVVGTASFATLGKAAAALRQLAISGEVIDFQNPDVMATISASGLANFLTNDTMKRVYSDNYLGQYAGAAQIETPDLPVLTTPAEIPAATITLGDAVVDSDSNPLGFAEITQISGTGLKAGYVYKASGLKVVDTNGIETNQDYAIIVLDDAGHISPLRITLPGKAYNNPNAVVPAGTTTLSLVAALSASTTYYIGQCRTKDCFTFDSYKFDDLPGSDNEAVGVVGGKSVKMSMYGEGNNLNKLIRMDSPYAAGLFETRGSVTVYIPQA